MASDKCQISLKKIVEVPVKKNHNKITQYEVVSFTSENKLDRFFKLPIAITHTG